MIYTALISIIPVILLFVLMLGFKMPGHKSAVITLIVTMILALLAVPQMNMMPESLKDANVLGVVGWSFVEGMLKAVFPILIIILMAIYSYNILVETKQIEVIKSQFMSISEDRGVLVLMLVWGFGGLLEGMAGFGTAVAIPAAILISFVKQSLERIGNALILLNRHSDKRPVSVLRKKNRALLYIFLDTCVVVAQI